MKTLKHFAIVVILLATGAAIQAQTGGDLLDTWSALAGTGAQSRLTNNRVQIVTSLGTVYDLLAWMDATKASVDALVTATSDPTMTQVEADWEADFQAKFNAFGPSPALARQKLAVIIQLISKHGGLEGGASQLRLTAGGTPVALP